jgi:hypothetical protein
MGLATGEYLTGLIPKNFVAEGVVEEGHSIHALVVVKNI